MKTIKQIADEIGVSKQAIHKKRHKEPLSTSLRPFTTTVDGVVYISVDGEKLIKQAFSSNDLSTTVDGVDDNQLTVVDGNLEVVEILKKQLETKDMQIERLQKELEAAHKIIDQAQQLQALSEQKIKLLEQPQKIKKWYQFWR